MSYIKVKPAKEGNIIRHPGNMRPLSQEGEEVEHSSFWERRIKDGDVVVIDNFDSSTNENDIGKDAINRVSTKNKIKEDNT